MEVYISIDGVIRNTIQKFDYHYKDAYIDSDIEGENTFEYGIEGEIKNDNLLNYYKFQSEEEFKYFLYIEYPIEIFGHAGLSYPTTFTDLHKLIFDNPEHNFTLISLDEFGKAKPATLFFLSKNGFLGSNIKFDVFDNIEKIWDKCDMWITDSKFILDKKPNDKIGYKFQTTYNQHFTYEKEINKLTEITEPWLKFLEKSTTLTSTELPTSVEQEEQ